jgi:hypothetical protein
MREPRAPHADAVLHLSHGLTFGDLDDPSVVFLSGKALVNVLERLARGGAISEPPNIQFLKAGLHVGEDRIVSDLRQKSIHIPDRHEVEMDVD